MPRGAVTVLEEGSYAANGIKHCVRPMDMAGKSAGKGGAAGGWLRERGAEGC